MSRSRRFGDVLVQVDRRDGEGVGSRVLHGGNTYLLPHWPARFERVSELGNGLAVTFTDGSQRVLDPRYDALQETAAGGSMGGHDPRAHGKIRYIVRSFGQWAKGKHHVCVRRIATEHPEILKGRDPNALCAWLKDQWMGTTKWRRGKGESESAYKKREGGLRKAAMSAAEARIGVPEWLPIDALDALVEDVQMLTGISPDAILEEIGGTASAGEDVFAAIYAADAAVNSGLLAEAVFTAREALRNSDSAQYRSLLEQWLALHGDTGSIREDLASVREALRRAVTLTAPSVFDRGRSEVECRVMECQRGVYEVAEEGQMEHAQSATRTVYEDPITGEQYVAREDPLLAARAPARPEQFREASATADDTTYEWPRDLASLSADELRERAGDLYVATGNATPIGRARINAATPVELVRMIVDLRERSADLDEISKPGYQGAAKKCKNCGGAVKAGRRTCHNCGSSSFVEAGEPTPEEMLHEADAQELDRLLAVSGESMRAFQASYVERNSEGYGSRGHGPNNPARSAGLGATAATTAEARYFDADLLARGAVEEVFEASKRRTVVQDEEELAKLKLRAQRDEDGVISDEDEEDHPDEENEEEEEEPTPPPRRRGRGRRAMAEAWSDAARKAAADARKAKGKVRAAGGRPGTASAKRRAEIIARMTGGRSDEPDPYAAARAARKARYGIKSRANPGGIKEEAATLSPAQREQRVKAAIRSAAIRRGLPVKPDEEALDLAQRRARLVVARSERLRSEEKPEEPKPSDDAVTSEKISDGAITSEKVTDGTVTTASECGVGDHITDKKGRKGRVVSKEGLKLTVRRPDGTTFQTHDDDITSLRESVLTSKARSALPKSAFALPGGRYPIHDESHARNALSRVAQHGSPEEKAKVRAAVKRRYPHIGESAAMPPFARLSTAAST